MSGPDLFLTDSGLETELLFLDGWDLPHFASYPLLEHDAGRERLARYVRTFVELAGRTGVGAVLETPTWRASADWGARLGHDARALATLNAAAVALVRGVVAEEPRTVPVVVSGNLGPRGDGYDASTRTTAEEARAYHRPQVEALAGAGADQVCVLTMTHLEEAVGVVRAAADVGVPVVASFTVETDGRLPSGQQLGEAVTRLDESTDGYARHLGVNCAHPEHVEPALADLTDRGAAAGRVRMLRVNASRLSHAELDEATELDDGDPVELGAQVADLRHRYPQLSVLGGCCGTDARHVAEIARAVTADRG